MESNIDKLFQQIVSDEEFSQEAEITSQIINATTEPKLHDAIIHLEEAQAKRDQNENYELGEECENNLTMANALYYQACDYIMNEYGLNKNGVQTTVVRLVYEQLRTDGLLS